MILRIKSWKKAGFLVESSVRKHCARPKSTKSSSAAQSFRVSSPKDKISKEDLKHHYKSISKKADQQRSQERDFYLSVLESSSATKRDAKSYLQTFGPTVTKITSNDLSKVSAPAASQVVDAASNDSSEGSRAISESPQFVQGRSFRNASKPLIDATPHVAVVKFRLPQNVDEVVLEGVAKTIAQLRTLGLLSVVVVDCESNPTDEEWYSQLSTQADRLANAINEFGEPWTTVVGSALSMSPRMADAQASPFIPSTVMVTDGDCLFAPLKRGAAVVIPSLVYDQSCKAWPVSCDEIIGSITRYLSGMQFMEQAQAGDGQSDEIKAPKKKALVDRVIILDPLGGIPAKDRWNNAHLFLNLEDEFDSSKAYLSSVDLTTTTSQADLPSTEGLGRQHIKNLELTKRVLTILPSTSSALITTPSEAANLAPQIDDGIDDSIMGFVGTVGTRKSHNPLIHNLLTDRPSQSSSLPLGRIKPVSRGSDTSPNPVLSPTTLVKRGMHITMFPDTRVGPWTPPKPGSPRLRLTDTCIDLPRLVHLIQDSFGRKLDVQDYLNRVEQSLAGIIIAGEYEGGAILTWERPFGIDEKTAYESGRLVPYLDKFAVLKKSQGAGGVADIVFTAMVRDCFPEGVCWRSRKNNPVNKWYFERSRGTWKLGGTEWAMFWTTPSVTTRAHSKVRDYEDVCRNVQPSWADKKHILD